MLALAVFVPYAWPQASTASVSGTVRDQSAAVIPGASVTLTNQATNVTAKTTANQVGFYMFPGVVPGQYKLAAEATGMQKFEGNLAVQVAQSAVVNVTLNVGQTATEIAVKDVTPMVQTEAPTLGHTLERSRIETLPINGRFLSSLLQTVPGQEGFRAFGLRQMSFEVSLDGAAMADRYSWNTITGRQPGLDSIQEFRVENNSSSARYTRPTSIIATTKGGTNGLHGTAFETNRNSGYGVARNREDTFTKAPFLNRNEFGFSVGGPVWLPKIYNGKNKLFWFTSWEWYREIGANTMRSSLPTAEMRKGDLSQLMNSSGNPITIYDPWTTDTTTWARQPFQGNQLPQSKQSPLSKYLLPYTQMPTLTNVNPYATQNYVGMWSRPTMQYTGANRVDYKLGDKDSFYGRFSKGRTRNLSIMYSYGIPSTDWSKVPGNTQGTISPSWSFAASWVHTFSPSFFNELLVTGSRTKQDTLTGDPTVCYDCILGLPNPFNSNQWPGLYNLAFGNNTMWETQNGTSFYAFYGIVDDNATKIMGKHELQFGFHYRPDRMNLLPQQQQTGGSDSWSSTGTALYDPTTSRTNPGTTPYTGDNFANYYLGIGRYNNQLNRGMFYARSKEWAGYFQDNWRVTPRLTLNLGLRYEVYPPFFEKNNTTSSFDYANHAVVLGTPLDKFYALGATFPAIINKLASMGVKYEQNDQAGLPGHQINTSYDGWGPRLGFAYRAGDGAKSFVLRGGYRISYFHFVMGGWAARMRMNIPMTARFYGPNGDPEQSAYSPDLIGNYLLRSVPTYISGKNTTDLVQPTDARSLTPGCCMVSYFNKDMPDPRVQDWNLTAEKEIMANTVARVGYWGNHQSRLEQKWMFNEGTPAYVWYMTKGVATPTGTYSGVATRPYDSSGAYGTLERWQNTGWGNSNGFQMELERRYSKGYSYQLFYILSNTMQAGGDGYSNTSNIPELNQYLPGVIPTDIDARNQLLNYRRETGTPHHRVRWNFLVDLPVGKGKPILGGAGKWLNRLVGGWQVAGMGSLSSTYGSYPTGQFPTGNPFQFYGYKYPIQDCTGTSASATTATCYPGYLWYNGYIPAYRINSKNANGVPNGYLGIPADYKPAYQPLWPYPADYTSRSAATDPLYNWYGGNTLWLPIKDANGNNIIQRQGWSGLDPLRQQYFPSIRSWGFDASAFKTIPITESVNVRFNADFFNVLNHPGNPNSIGGTGILSVRNSGVQARQIQLTLRLTW